jgi:hypothetical protein
MRPWQQEAAHHRIYSLPRYVKIAALGQDYHSVRLGWLRLPQNTFKDLPLNTCPYQQNSAWWEVFDASSDLRIATFGHRCQSGSLWLALQILWNSRTCHVITWQPQEWWAFPCMIYLYFVPSAWELFINSIWKYQRLHVFLMQWPWTSTLINEDGTFNHCSDPTKLILRYG